MKPILTVLALALCAWWLQRQFAISRREELTTLDRLKHVLKKEAA